MDVGGKFVAQQRWILERTEDDNVAETSFWRRDLLPREILGKFAERPWADAGPATSDLPVCPTYRRPDSSRRKTPAVRGFSPSWGGLISTVMLSEECWFGSATPKLFQNRLSGFRD
jgi:hypothetical protein